MVLLRLKILNFLVHLLIEVTEEKETEIKQASMLKNTYLSILKHSSICPHYTVYLYSSILLVLPMLICDIKTIVTYIFFLVSTIYSIFILNGMFIILRIQNKLHLHI